LIPVLPTTVPLAELGAPPADVELFDEGLLDEGLERADGA